jgi:lipopolysaccharide export system protein LptC
MSLTAARIADTGTHGWTASGPRDLKRLLRRARRHSASVRLMRLGIPAGAVAAVGGFVLLSYLNPMRVAELPISAANMVISGSKITMEVPRLTGYTRDTRAYHVTADAAAQDFTNPTVLELSGIRANMEMQNKGTVNMTAVAGVYNTKSEQLTLTQHIILISSEGYEARLTEATADVKKGYIVSEKPVEVFLTNGKLNANRMEVVNNGEVLRFDGGIVLDLNGAKPGTQDGRAAATRGQRR